MGEFHNLHTNTQLSSSGIDTEWEEKIQLWSDSITAPKSGVDLIMKLPRQTCGPLMEFGMEMTLCILDFKLKDKLVLEIMISEDGPLVAGNMIMELGQGLQLQHS